MAQMVGTDEIESLRTDNKEKRVTDVTKLGPEERHLFIERLIKDIEQDNLGLLRKIRNRIDR
jgi:hypothetical protein